MLEGTRTPITALKDRAGPAEDLFTKAVLRDRVRDMLANNRAAARILKEAMSACGTTIPKHKARRAPRWAIKETAPTAKSKELAAAWTMMGSGKFKEGLAELERLANPTTSKARSAWHGYTEACLTYEQMPKPITVDKVAARFYDYVYRKGNSSHSLMGLVSQLKSYARATGLFWPINESNSARLHAHAKTLTQDRPHTVQYAAPVTRTFIAHLAKFVDPFGASPNHDDRQTLTITAVMHDGMMRGCEATNGALKTGDTHKVCDGLGFRLDDRCANALRRQRTAVSTAHTLHRAGADLSPAASRYSAPTAETQASR